MLAPKYFIYLASGPGRDSKIELSSNLSVDAAWLEQAGYGELAIYQPAQPLYLAEIVQQALNQQPQLQPKGFLKKLQQLLKGLNAPQYGRLLMQPVAGQSKPLPELSGVEQLFWGRSLLGSELPELLRAGGYAVPWNPEDWMQQLYLVGKIRRVAAVGYNRWGVPECRRCGATAGIYESQCLFCGNPHCLTCTNCQSLGLAKSCVPLYYVPYPASVEVAQEVKAVLEFELTPAQQQAAAAVLCFLDSGGRTFLVWSVCGGGKTEVCFSAVARVLSQGGRVLVAIPRKEVVAELLPRFAAAFPELDVTALYGGSADRWRQARLVLATTHQCLRLYQGFDLVVLDEADAFPYQGSPMLHFAVGQALKSTGQLIIMTATPDQTLVTQVRNGQLPHVLIPARYHRQPLIVPQFIKTKFTGHQGAGWAIPLALQQQLSSARRGKRKVMVFLPTLRLIETLGRTLVAWGATQGLAGAITHSKCHNSPTIKERLKAGDLDFVVTSTVFERGITIRDVEVAVLFADYESVFDCRTLVQIAGRTGRQGESAAVIWYAQTNTRAMRECLEWIAQMNREGLRQGYLDAGSQKITIHYHFSQKC